MSLLYKQVTTEQELIGCMDVIQKSFATVAKDFQITKENAPTNPAFIQLRHLQKNAGNGVMMFGVYKDIIQIGFFAIENKEEDDYWLERLAVLPGHRHNGYGRKMVDFAVQYVAEQGGTAVSIGVIGTHEVLKAWYRKLGFIELETHCFLHLPFPVSYMKKEGNGKAGI